MTNARSAVATLGFYFLACALSTHAQEPPAAPTPLPPAPTQDPLNRDSPQTAVFSFLEACHSKNYRRAWHYLDLRGLPIGERLKKGPQLAQDLAHILDNDAQFEVAALSRSPEGDQEDGLPRGHEQIASVTVNGKSLGLQMARVKLRSGLEVWLFSPETLALIPEAARSATASPIEKFLPDPLVDWKWIDTSLWRWIVLFLFAAALAAISRLLSLLALRLLDPALSRWAPRMERGAFKALTPPLRLLFSVGCFRAGVEWAGASALLRLYLSHALTLLFFLGLAWLGMAIADLALARLRLALETRHQTFLYSALPLASRVVKLAILMVAAAAILSEWGYNTTTILAGLGVGGLAIALAGQKTIENLFGGVAVITDRPVAAGDFCRFGERVGTVEDIGLWSTRIRTLDRTVVTVPNGQFSSMTLENFTRRDKMWFHITLNLRRDTGSDQMRALLEAIAAKLKEHPKVEVGSLPVRFIGVGTYSLDVEVFAYILTRNYDEFLQLQQELLLWILETVDAVGTALAIPTQASINYPPPGVPSLNGAARLDTTQRSFGELRES